MSKYTDLAMERRSQFNPDGKPAWNCCQAVVRAFADTLDMPVDKLMQLSAGFGSGMGTMEGTCGAIAGAIVVAGLRTGGNGTMSLSRKILPRFKELCGATICRDLKGIGTGKILCSCENCVRNAVLAAEEALETK
jgi:C_GCAxxG_C_C family probable redox protein